MSGLSKQVFFFFPFLIGHISKVLITKAADSSDFIQLQSLNVHYFLTGQLS